MRLFIAILSLLFCLELFASSGKENKSSDVVFFFGANDVLSMYEGSWYGSKQLFLRGKLLGDTTVESRNTLLAQNILDYTRQERLLDKAINIQAKILSLGDKIYMTYKDENGKDVIYEGIVKSNSVEWYRSEKIFAFDYTKDIFIKKDDKIYIQSYAVKPFINDSNLMYIEYKGIISKDISTNTELEIHIDNLDISKLRM